MLQVICCSCDLLTDWQNDLTWNEQKGQQTVLSEYAVSVKIKLYRTKRSAVDSHVEGQTETISLLGVPSLALIVGSYLLLDAITRID